MLQIFMFTIQNRTVQESIATHSLRLLNQLLHRIHLCVQLINAGAIDGSADFDTVLKTLEDRVYRDNVAIVHGESGIFLVIHIIYLHLATALTDNADGFLIGIALETAGILQQTAGRLAGLQFIEHRALHFTQNLHQRQVGLHQNDIPVLQTDIVFHLTFQDKVIHIQVGNYLSVAHHPDAAQATDIIDATRTIQGMENGGERRQHISAGHGYLTHHIHLDGANLAQRQLHLRIGDIGRYTRVNLRKFFFQVIIGLLHGLAAQINRA